MNKPNQAITGIAEIALRVHDLYIELAALPDVLLFRS